MGHVVGIDTSTTATKAVLVDERGAVVGIGVSEYDFEIPRPGWTEQSPTLWWDATVAAIREVLGATGVSGDSVAAIGLTGQMHGLVLLGADDAVLRPAILWNDQRTAAACDAIRETIGLRRLIDITGNDALTGFTAPKLVWVRDNEPDVWSRVAHVLLPKDYVRLRLTGDHALDKADGAGTILFDLAARDWSREVVDGLGIDPSWLPPTFEGPEVTGSVSAVAAEATGLRAGTPVIAGGGDQAANAVGVGAVEPGVVALSLGTSGVVFATTDRPLRDPAGQVHAFCHAVPGRWHLMTVMLSAAGSLRWFRDTFAPGEDYAAAGRGGRRRTGGLGRAAVPAVSQRRAEPTPGSRGTRRVRRAIARTRPPAPDAGRAGGRGLRAARWPRPDDRDRDGGAGPDPGVRWWHGESRLAADPGRRARGRARDGEHDRGCRLRGGVAGRRGCRLVSARGGRGRRVRPGQSGGITRTG